LTYKTAANDLPATESFGAAYRPFDSDAYGSALVGLQGEKTTGEIMRYRFGTEYAYGLHDSTAFFLRAGIRMQFESQDYSIGLGFREKKF